MRGASERYGLADCATEGRVRKSLLRRISGIAVPGSGRTPQHRIALTNAIAMRCQAEGESNRPGNLRDDAKNLGGGCSCSRRVSSLNDTNQPGNSLHGQGLNP